MGFVLSWRVSTLLFGQPTRGATISTTPSWPAMCLGEAHLPRETRPQCRETIWARTLRKSACSSSIRSSPATYKTGWRYPEPPPAEHSAGGRRGSGARAWGVRGSARRRYGDDAGAVARDQLRRLRRPQWNLLWDDVQRHDRRWRYGNQQLVV